MKKEIFDFYNKENLLNKIKNAYSSLKVGVLCNEYANDETQLCFLWKPNSPFQSGKYKVEIYNKGSFAGSDDFELK